MSLAAQSIKESIRSCGREGRRARRKDPSIGSYKAGSRNFYREGERESRKLDDGRKTKADLVLLIDGPEFALTNCVFFGALQGHLIGCHTGNGDQLSSNQAEPGQAINSAVAYFPSISCATSCPLAL